MSDALVSKLRSGLEPHDDIINSVIDLLGEDGIGRIHHSNTAESAAFKAKYLNTILLIHILRELRALNRVTP